MNDLPAVEEWSNDFPSPASSRQVSRTAVRTSTSGTRAPFSKRKNLASQSKQQAFSVANSPLQSDDTAMQQQLSNNETVAVFIHSSPHIQTTSSSITATATTTIEPREYFSTVEQNPYAAHSIASTQQQQALPFVPVVSPAAHMTARNIVQQQQPAARIQHDALVDALDDSNEKYGKKTFTQYNHSGGTITTHSPTLKLVRFWLNFVVNSNLLVCCVAATLDCIDAGSFNILERCGHYLHWCCAVLE